jgi:hypothetical protein
MSVDLPPHPLIERSNLRTIAPDYSGDLVLWDIDKTYLDTHFSSLRGLAAIPFELAIDKEAVPGAVPLLRALRRGGTDKHVSVPLYFVSGSPPQLRSIVERKMTLDGVQFDGITFKDQWGFVRARRPKGIKEQVGYKLRALLLYRLEIGGPSRWFLFGDDAESDADVFSLFGEVCAGLRGAHLDGRLAKAKVHRDDVRNIHEIAERVPVTDNPVERIFIHLYNRTPPEKLATDKVVPTYSFLQAALVLASIGRISDDAIHAVANDLRRNGRVPEAEIARQLDDAQRRLQVTEALCDRARPS